jgi:hypothetical protein
MIEESEGDPASIAVALGNIARAKGIWIAIINATI